MKRRKIHIIIIPLFIIFSAILVWFLLYYREVKKIKYTYSIIKTAVENQEYNEAYMWMTRRFRDELPFQKFPLRCQKMAELNTNQIIFSKRNGNVIAFMYKKGDYLSIEFNKHNGKWLCDGIRIQSYPHE